MKTTAILVPIDFTRAANNTINYAMAAPVSRTQESQ